MFHNVSTTGDTGTSWLSMKNTYTYTHSADVTVFGYTVSECLSFCEQGFPSGCKSVVYISTGACELRTTSRVHTPGFKLWASSERDYYEITNEGVCKLLSTSCVFKHTF